MGDSPDKISIKVGKMMRSRCRQDERLPARSHKRNL